MFKFIHRFDAWPIVGTVESYGKNSAGKLTITVRSKGGVLVTMEAADVMIEIA